MKFLAFSDLVSNLKILGHSTVAVVSTCPVPGNF